MAESAEHITCHEVVELVTDFLEDGMSAHEKALFEQHLNFCDGCVWYVDQIRATVATVGRIREEEVPAETRARLMAAFRDWERS
jgi:hypothetical protein